MRTLSQLLAVCLLVLTLGQLPAFALFDDFNHPELKWMSFETDHFVIYYTEGLEDVASMAAQVAEEVHGPLCTLYGYHPDTKVSLIFSDADDIANAATYFQSNKIHFYATSMAWDFRGTHNWLRNVVTHEYTHMIELGAARKWTRKIPAFYVQFLGYEPERRPDVLYGYPNRLISWPLPSVTVPAWFAEGTAQYQFNGNGYDYWDSHRDMLLRQATLSNRLLSFEDMAYFGKTSLESEGVYNQGFAFTRYIATQSGDPKVLERISHELARPAPVTMNAAMKRATGKSGNDWYKEWRTSLEQEYRALRDRLAPTLTHADTVSVQGYVNLYPRLSPDCSKVAFVSNEKRDYFGQSSLYIYHFADKKAELVAPAAHTGLCWLPDGSGVLFTRQNIRPISGSAQHDIYLYELKSKKVTRISNGLRAETVDISPDGKTLVFTINEQGRRELAFAPMPEVSKKGKPFTRESLLYRHPSLPHEQYYLPRWSADGKYIAVAEHLQDGRSLHIFEVQDGARGLTLKQEFNGRDLELRDASWAPDGKSLLVAWDESGISNIYRLNLADSSRQQLTSVLGGAYYPDQRGDRLVYADFCGQGYRICKLDNASTIAVADPPAEGATYASRLPKPNFPLTTERRTGKLYKPTFENLYWFPRIAFDYGTFKPGVYLLLNDVLEKLDFLGGFAINQKKDYDLFGSVEYRALYPTIFAEYYNVQRNLSSHFADSTRIIGEDTTRFLPIYDQYGIKYRYNLNEIEAGVKVPVGKGTYAKVSGLYDRYTAHNRFDDGSTIGLTYFKGWSGRVGYYTDQRRSGIASEINPSGGYKGYIELSRANHLFFTGFDIAGSTIGLKEAYAHYNYDLVEGGAEKYFPLPGWDHALELRARGGLIDRKVDPFFYLYAGGLPGMRGYSFYSLGGRQIAVGTLTYRFPIVRRADWNLWPLSVNRIYGSVYSDFGGAFHGDVHPGGIKKDIGAGLRIQLHSFYSYPTAISFDAAYGFDKFAVSEQGRSVTEYGKEVRYYLTVLFDFYSPFAGRGSGPFASDN